MSKVVSTGYRSGKRLPRATEHIAESGEGEPIEDDAEEYIDEEEEVIEKVGLFGTPARAFALGVSILLLFAVVGTAAWALGQSSKKPGGTSLSASTTDPNSEVAFKANTSDSRLKPVPSINNANASYSSNPSGLSEAPRIGSLPPNFQWTDQKSGQPVTLESLRGKPLLLNFWGTWCPPCKAEMPEMQKIYDQQKDRVRFLGVTMGPRDEPLGVAQFVQLENYTWDFIHDPNSDVMNRYQVTGIPSSYYIDKNGVIRAIFVGGADQPTIEANLKKAEDSQ